MTLLIDRKDIVITTFRELKYHITFDPKPLPASGSGGTSTIEISAPEIPEAFLQGWNEAEAGDLEDFGEGLDD